MFSKVICKNINAAQAKRGDPHSDDRSEEEASWRDTATEAGVAPVISPTLLAAPLWPGVLCKLKLQLDIRGHRG